MAMTDLIIWPRTKTLRYASSAFDEMRLIFEDLSRAADDPAKVRRIARSGRGRAISAKATVDSGIDDAVAIAMEARQGPDPQGLDGEAATARAEGIAQNQSSGGVK